MIRLQIRINQGKDAHHIHPLQVEVPKSGGRAETFTVQASTHELVKEKLDQMKYKPWQMHMAKIREVRRKMDDQKWTTKRRKIL